LPCQIDCRLGNLPPILRPTARRWPPFATTAGRPGGLPRTQPDRVSPAQRHLPGDDGRRQFLRACEGLGADGLISSPMSCALDTSSCPRAERYITPAPSCTATAGTPFRHRKVYLPTYGMFEEERYMRPGDRFRTVDLTASDGETWRVACSFARTPGTIRPGCSCRRAGGPGAGAFRLAGPRVNPSGWAASGAGTASSPRRRSSALLRRLLQRVGFEDDIHFWGGSAVFAPDAPPSSKAS